MSRKFVRQYADAFGTNLEEAIGRRLLLSGTSVPSDGTAGFLPGALYFKTDAAGTAAWYRNDGTLASCDFNLFLAGVDLSTLAATATEINRLAAANATFSTTAGTGITGGTGTVIKYSVSQFGTIIYSAIYIDLTGLQAIATDGDVIGDSTNPAYLGRITAARNGTVDMGAMTCLEAPAGGSADINLCTAIEATLKKDDAISGGTGVQTLVDAAGNWTNGTCKGMLNTPITANNYLYLTNGAGAGAGTYTAGKFLLEFYGF